MHEVINLRFQGEARFALPAPALLERIKREPYFLHVAVAVPDEDLQLEFLAPEPTGTDDDRACLQDWDDCPRTTLLSGGITVERTARGKTCRIVVDGVWACAHLRKHFWDAVKKGECQFGILGFGFKDEPVHIYALDGYECELTGEHLGTSTVYSDGGPLPNEAPPLTEFAGGDSMLVAGSMYRFDVAEPPADFTELPPAFREAYDIWNSIRDEESDSEVAEQGRTRIHALLTPFLTAHLVMEIEGWEDFFTDPRDTGRPGYEIVSVQILDVDFSTTPFPICSAEALLRVPVKPEFWTMTEEAWGERGGEDVYVSFGWNVPRSEGTRGNDYTWENNEGYGCVWPYQPERGDGE